MAGNYQGPSFSELQQQLYYLNKQKESELSDKLKSLYESGLDATFLSAGWGEYNKQIVNHLAKFERYGTRFVMDNYLRTGYIFITRPELNLTSVNLRQNRIMHLLDIMDPKSIQFGLRAYLDTRFTQRNLEIVAQCPYLDYRSPFFNLLMNNIQDFSGGPSYQLSVYTEEEGFFGEAQSMSIGSDSYSKPFDIQMNVVDPIGGPISAVMNFWLLYIDLLHTGEMIMYPDQIYERVLNYTVSIYRFIMDPTFRYIRRWAKYTGCFPISHPGASIFDFNGKGSYVDSVRKFSLGFRCGSGNVDVDDPIVIEEFNTVVEKYFPEIGCLREGGSRLGPRAGKDIRIHRALIPEDQIDETLEKHDLVRNPLIPEYNFTGVPYILDTKHGLKLEVFSHKNELDPRKIVVSKKPNKVTGEYDIRWPLMEKMGVNVANYTTGVNDMVNALIENYETERANIINGVTYI